MTTSEPTPLQPPGMLSANQGMDAPHHTHSPSSPRPWLLFLPPLLLSPPLLILSSLCPIIVSPSFVKLLIPLRRHPLSIVE